MLPEKVPEEHTAEAEARVNLIGVMPGINPRHNARMSVSATREVVP